MNCLPWATCCSGVERKSPCWMFHCGQPYQLLSWSKSIIIHLARPKLRVWTNKNIKVHSTCLQSWSVRAAGDSWFGRFTRVFANVIDLTVVKELTRLQVQHRTERDPEHGAAAASLFGLQLMFSFILEAFYFNKSAENDELHLSSSSYQRNTEPLTNA